MERFYDFLIVGSGLYGATFAYLAKKAGFKCLVIEKRTHLGGNIYCDKIEGINVHKYGAHIFHTSDDEVWKLVNDIVPFNRYTNSPIAVGTDGKVYNLPFNMNTFYQLWQVKTPMEAMAKLKEQRRSVVARMERDGVTAPRNLEEQAGLLIGPDIYNTLIKDYTEKQWGRPCNELPPFIINRLPVRLVYDNNYFNDKFQGIPIGGYNELTKGLLEGIETRTECDYFECREELNQLAKHIVFTGKIDEFFDYRFGHLEYRTVRFRTRVEPTANYQGNAVVNYISKEIPYTRVIEHKHFECFGDAVYEKDKTVVSEEYSMEWAEGMEPFYPINDERNMRILSLYKALAKDTEVIFGGRLAEYKYYDMAPTVRAAIDAFNAFMSTRE